MSADKIEDEVDDDTWTKVASGDLSDVIDWEADFEALGEVQSVLSQLEGSGRRKR
jgi:hypothetical protein